MIGVHDLSSPSGRGIAQSTRRWRPWQEQASWLAQR